MKLGRRAITWAASAALAVATVSVFPAVSHADDATTKPAAAPAAPEAAAAPDAPVAGPEAPVSISPEAHKVLDQVKAAYGSLKSLQTTGTINENFDVDGEQKKKHFDFTSLFQAGGKFRNEVKDDAVIGFNGDKLYFYVQPKNSYLLYDAPKDKVDLSSINSDVADVIRQQNMSLSLALAPDASTELTDGAATVTRGDDVKIDDATYATLVISQKAMDITLAVDSQTHLIRRESLDLTKMAKLKNAQVVKTALVTVDFTNVVNGNVADKQFAWAPPDGAQEVHLPKDASTLKGQPAPAFSLEGVDGKKIANADLKGSIYVLDFWATWCGPCVGSLPGLDKIYQDKKGDGLKVYAVNQQEDKDTVQKFTTKTSLTIPVLFDTDAKVAEAYLVTGIPETVLVGKDGKVIEVWVGVEPDHEAHVLAAVEKAMKAN